ncbi:MAG TPA: choice-of-anchor Q domain-containing protein, partial [Roseiflexaceae bacterium]|nr:choice-of-anchor Q domain-containing protein [Roseiflexaceae bacterium]
AVDAAGDLLLADYQNHRVLAYDAERIGNGATGSCTEVALDEALVGGGAIRFDCGTAVINLNSVKTINAPTTIDGGGKITLSGQNARQLFAVAGGARLTLRNIVLADGLSGGDGGAISTGLGSEVSIEHSTIRNSKALASGGAIVSYGPLTIVDSVLEDNQALNGGALYPRWTGADTKIVNSVLRNNQATDTANGWGGAILSWDGALVRIQGSDISNNHAQFGGAIYNFANSVLWIENKSRLHDNSAGYGGALYNNSVAALQDVAISNNAAGSGGGVLNNDSLTLNLVTLAGNTATGYGGGLYTNQGTATLNAVVISVGSAGYGGGIFSTGNGLVLLADSTVSGNSAGNGGGISNDNSTLTLSASTISGNSADSGGGLENNGTATLTNATISGNSAKSGGGLFNLANATLTNVTISGNTGTIIGGAVSNFRTLTLKNTIVANSASSGNCYNDSGPAASLTSAGYNISSDSTCGLSGAGDRNNINPLLGALGNYGGSTLVHMPKSGSLAIDGIFGSDVPSYDQRGVLRPQGAGYDIGAVERRAIDADYPPRAYIPMVIR